MNPSLQVLGGNAVVVAAGDGNIVAVRG